MDTDDKPKTRKIKKQVRKGDLPIVAGTASLDDGTKTTLAEAESSMIMEDKLVADTEDKKNELETYIYEMRNKIDDTYSSFASEAEKEKLKAKLEASEDWLYDEGEDTTKAVYIAKIDEIRAVAGPIVQRYFDKVEEERAAAQAVADAEAAKKREMAEAARKAAMAQEDAGKAEKKDEEMPDVKDDAPEVEEK
jgi:heat shock protein 4